MGIVCKYFPVWKVFPSQSLLCVIPCEICIFSALYLPPDYPKIPLIVTGLLVPISVQGARLKRAAFHNYITIVQFLTFKQHENQRSAKNKPLSHLVPIFLFFFSTQCLLNGNSPDLSSALRADFKPCVQHVEEVLMTPRMKCIHEGTPQAGSCQRIPCV